MLELIFLLAAGHALADFGLQNSFMAAWKSRHFYTANMPNNPFWVYVLTSHALIHGLMVYLITKNIYLGLIETSSHWLIDFGKCEKWIGLHTDQCLHFAFKAFYVAYIASLSASGA